MKTKDEYLLNLVGQHAAQAAAEKTHLLIEIDKRGDEILSLRAEIEALKKSLAEKV